MKKGKVPFLVGGTGLYIDSVVDNYDFPEERNQDLRFKIQDLGFKSFVFFIHKSNFLNLKSWQL